VLGGDWLGTDHVFYAGAVVCLCAFVPYIAELAAVFAGELDLRGIRLGIVRP
jgi:hypothetical protein